MSDFAQRAQELVEAGRTLYAWNMVPATSGNLSARLDDGSFADRHDLDVALPEDLARHDHLQVKAGTTQILQGRLGPLSARTAPGGRVDDDPPSHQRPPAATTPRSVPAMARLAAGAKLGNVSRN